ncbi:hypothetical protein NST02_23590 [Robertmurraya sp. FSL W8-0741]|uniref:hypothetical protein n=1 Tax=Robertmurraya sp. FSL W8-0741 TaxID=2954629 RepID=UPI0030F5F8D1
MKCPYCKNIEITASDNYCKICGLKLKKSVAEPTTTINVQLTLNDKVIAKDLIQEFKKILD